MRVFLLYGVLGLLSGFTACDPVPVFTGDQDFPLAVGIGTGPLTVYNAGDPLPLERGFQGGQHINAVLQSPGLGEQTGDSVLWLIDEQEQLLFRAAQAQVSFAPAVAAGANAPENTTSEAYGRLLIESPGDVLGRELELRVHVVLSDGRTAQVAHRGPVEWLAEDYRVKTTEGPPEDNDTWGEPAPDAGL
ncbi:MAG: hypothetical protein ACO3JL_08155 [Myxococcota bacterium]